MIFRKLQAKKSEKKGMLGSYLGPGLKVEGSLEVKGDIRIDGEIKGNVFAEQDLLVGEKAEIQGDIVAENITIGGEVVGNVTANEKVELLKNAQLLGDIKASRVVIAEGVVFEGNCMVGSQGGQKDNDSDLNLDFDKPSEKKDSLVSEEQNDSSSF